MKNTSQVKIYKIRLKVGDMVIVRSGKYKGRSGKITAIHPRLNKVTVEGLNIVKRHVKPTTANPRGGIVELTRPIDVSKLGYFDSTAKKPARLAYKLGKEGSKARVLAKTGKEIK